MKTVWFIHEYGGSPYHGMQFRSYYLMRQLAKKGYKTYLITANFSHLLNVFPKVEGEYKVENIDGVNYVWIKVPRYRHAHDKKRIIKWLYFGYKVYSILSRGIIDRPDVIIDSSPSLFHVVSAYKLAKKFNCKFFFEVRDIWPLSVIEIGGYSPYHPFIKLMEYLEKFAYKKADKVISILPLAYEHMIKQGMPKDKFVHLPNGICLDDIKQIEPLSAEVEQMIPKDKFLVAYTGTIGKANALEYLVKAAKILQDKNYTDIAILIVGKGMEAQYLKQMCKNFNLKNVIFIPPVKKSQVQSLLRLVDVAYIGLKKEPLFKYGVAPNKLFEYMFAAKPIIYAINSGNHPVQEANCGVEVEAGNPQAIAEGILKLYKLPKDELIKLGKNGYDYVIKNHTFKVLGDMLEKIIF